MNNQPTPAEQAAESFLDMLTETGAIYAYAAARSNMDQAVVFAVLRDELAKQLDVSPLRAANMARMAIAMGVKKLGCPAQYNIDEMKVIFNKAFPS